MTRLEVKLHMFFPLVVVLTRVSGGTLEVLVWGVCVYLRMIHGHVQELDPIFKTLWTTSLLLEILIINWFNKANRI